MASATHNEEFIYLASHQLRNPVTRIRWMLELLLEDKKLKGRTKKYLTLIRTSAVRLNDIITVLLNVSRIERGKMFFSPRSIDLVKFIKNFLNEYSSLSAEKNISVIFKKHPSTLPAMIDSAAIYNIFQSLISNAIEYTQEKGRIEVSLEQRNNTFRFMVRDTGIGIPKKDQGHIFEKFRRASNAKVANREGLGLGLYAASQTVKLLSGKIWFESPAPGQGKEKDKGTIFYVELPLTCAQ